MIFEYPNGEQYVARNPETDERLLVGGNKPLVIQADEAEQLGLAEWMPYTQPEPEARVYVPSSPPPIRRRGQSRRDFRSQMLDYMIDEALSIWSTFTNEEGKANAQRLYTPRE